MILAYPALMGRPIILAVVQDLMGGEHFLVPMLLDTGADQTCFPSKLAGFFGHNNDHPDVIKDICNGIGGASTSYLHSVQVSLIDPKKSTQKKPVVAWTAPDKTAAFVENLDCGFGLIGMDLIKQWKHLSFEPNQHGLMIRIVIERSPGNFPEPSHRRAIAGFPLVTQFCPPYLPFNVKAMNPAVVAQFASTPSPRLSGERAGVRGFELEKKAPPHPGPLLHFMEEREKNSNCTTTNPGWLMT